MTTTPTPHQHDAQIGQVLDLTTIDPFDLSPSAVDRLLADVMRPSLRDRMVEAVATMTTCGAHPSYWPDILVKIARDHYATYVVVDVGLTVDQLDIVVKPADHDEPLETLRDEIRDAARVAALEVIARRAPLLS